MLEWAKTKQFEGIVLAHKHLIDLRLNKYKNTAGLSGQYSKLIHKDVNNSVIAYHRKENGGPGDDTVVIINFGDQNLKDYALQLPKAPSQHHQWTVRFNSSWSGYGTDSHETNIDKAQPVAEDEHAIGISARSVVILSVE